MKTNFVHKYYCVILRSVLKLLLSLLTITYSVHVNKIDISYACRRIYNLKAFNVLDMYGNNTNCRNININIITRYKSTSTENDYLC